jgi:hypothetical protein
MLKMLIFLQLEKDERSDTEVETNSEDEAVVQSYDKIAKTQQLVANNNEEIGDGPTTALDSTFYSNGVGKRRK